MQTHDEPQTTTVYVIHWTCGGKSRPASSPDEARNIARAVMGPDVFICRPDRVWEADDREHWPEAEIWTAEGEDAQLIGEIRKEVVWE